LRGNVIGFDPDTNTGAISGHDGQRYDFYTADWHSHARPQHGDLVDFVAAGQRAQQIYLIEPEYAPPSLGAFLFSVRGRVSRSQLWLKWVLPVMAIHLVFGLIIAGIFAAGSWETAIVFVVIWVLFAGATQWPGIAILVKRMHDRNRSGWLVLAYCVPAGLQLLMIVGGASGNPITLTLSLITFGVGVWFFVEFGCLRGTFGVNEYGPDPVL
jgi:uncharacterized membrane protein YhaH (DUF805 family)